MIEIEKPRIDTEELSSDGKYGRFVVEPLERGFGNTLGNSLRRVLLSSLEGVAVTSIKIDGVLHEFSTVPGVKEDVTEIVLNMKSLVAKLHSNGPKIVEISAEGPCVVTAESIKCDSEVEILNPELHIATLADGATLNMEITLDKGRGYVPAEKNKLINGNERSDHRLRQADPQRLDKRRHQLSGGCLSRRKGPHRAPQSLCEPLRQRL